MKLVEYGVLPVQDISCDAFAPREGRKGRDGMKSILRWVYIALVGLIVFTGALFIAQGVIDGDQQPIAAEDSAPETTDIPQSDDASPAPRRMPEAPVPDGPAQFI